MLFLPQSSVFFSFVFLFPHSSFPHSSFLDKLRRWNSGFPRAYIPKFQTGVSGLRECRVFPLPFPLVNSSAPLRALIVVRPRLVWLIFLHLQSSDSLNVCHRAPCPAACACLQPVAPQPAADDLIHRYVLRRSARFYDALVPVPLHCLRPDVPHCPHLLPDAASMTPLHPAVSLPSHTPAPPWA